MPDLARLVIDGLDNWADCYELDPFRLMFTIGRGENCHIRLADDAVSTLHARIGRDDTGYLVQDEKSRNGTLLNGKKLEQPQVLRSGDLIEIEPFKIRFQLVTEEEEHDSSSSREILQREVERGEEETKTLLDQFDSMREHLRGLASAAGVVPSGEYRSVTPNTTPAPSIVATGQVPRAVYNELKKMLEMARRESRRRDYKYHMLRKASMARSLHEACQSLLDYAARALNADAAFLMMINPVTGRWEVRYRSGSVGPVALGGADAEPDPESGEKEKMPLSLSLVKRAVEEGRTILSDELGETTDSMVIHAIQSGIAAPLYEAGTVIGSLYFDRRATIEDSYDLADAADAAAFAEIVADAQQLFLLRAAYAREHASQQAAAD